jgi:hypothetical protein
MALQPIAMDDVIGVAEKNEITARLFHAAVSRMVYALAGVGGDVTNDW